MSEQIKTKYSVVDLFAGAGGLSLGFLQTKRFTLKAAFENNPNAQQTYILNHKGTAVYDDVAAALDDKTKAELGQVDVVIGGPPCQGFSNANRQKNHAISQNNSLVKKFVQAVLHLNPSAFIMENVSMLQSDIHRFYVAENDQANIEQYGIETASAEILLLDADYVFAGVETIVNDPVRVAQYKWNDNEYLTLNIIYKNQNDKDKLISALKKHENKLKRLADRLILNPDNEDPILEVNFQAGVALLKFFRNNKEEKYADDICAEIQSAIMIQRMLGKAKEILDNQIVVDKYTIENGLVAHVTSMAVIDYIYAILGSDDNGYSIDKGVLSAASFGAPQKRMRFVIMGVKKSIAEKAKLPLGVFSEDNYRTVDDAISDLTDIPVRTELSDDEAGINLPPAPTKISELARILRDSNVLKNHICTATTPEALERFKVIQQGGNFHSLPEELKKTYSDSKRTQNTIYLRLKGNEPSGTVVNVRKSMWIHPTLHRALSIREAARLQTFPDSFVFCGTKDSQYQQVGNAVPPVLAEALANHLCGYLDSEKQHG